MKQTLTYFLIGLIPLIRKKNNRLIWLRKTHLSSFFYMHVLKLIQWHILRGRLNHRFNLCQVQNAESCCGPLMSKNHGMHTWHTSIWTRCNSFGLQLTHTHVKSTPACYSLQKSCQNFQKLKKFNCMGSVFRTTAIRQHANLCKLAHESHCGKSADRADMILTKKHNKHEECINV